MKRFHRASPLAAEPDERRRGEYGGLALVFAEAADRKPVWKEALKGWNMKVSQQVLEWQAEAKTEAKIEAILEVLAARFSETLPTDLTEIIQKNHDLKTLSDWLKQASKANSLDDFRRGIVNGHS